MGLLIRRRVPMADVPLGELYHAESNRFDVGGLWRLTAWAGAAALSLAFVVLAFAVTPRIRSLGFWMLGQVQNLDISMPNGLTAKHFMHRHCDAMARTTLVQMLNGQFDTLQVFPIIRHSVRQVCRPRLRGECGRLSAEAL